MDESTSTDAARQVRGERLKKYLTYFLVLAIAAILIYVFVWFGTQLGLQG